MKVPYYKQEFPWSCFPACIRMLLEFYGIKKGENELRTLLKSTLYSGGSWFLVEAGLESLGLHFYYSINFSLEELKALIRNETPVIVSLKLSQMHPNHTVVVTDVTNEFIITNDPEKGENTKIDPKQFLEAWSARGYIAGYIKKI